MYSLKLIALFKIGSSHDNELFIIADNDVLTLGLILLVTSLSWAIFAYIWSNIFKSDITAFIMLFSIMSVTSCLDIISSLVKHAVYNDFRSKNGTSYTRYDIFRDSLTFLFPNVAVKRAVFYVKIKNILDCKTTPNETSISNLLLLNFCFFLCGVLMLYLIEKQFFTWEMIKRKVKFGQKLTNNDEERVKFY